MKILPISRRSHGALTVAAALAYAAPSLAQSQIWITERPTVGLEETFGVLSNGSAGSFLGGHVAEILHAPADLWLSRQDADGNELWVARFGTPVDDELADIMSDGGQGVVAAGSTFGDLGAPSAGSYDVWLAKYNEAGSQIWLRQFGSPGWDDVSSACSDGMGGFFLCGSTLGDLGAANVGGHDAWFGRFDSQGNQVWLFQLGTSSEDIARDVIADGQGGAFVTGNTGGALSGAWNGSWDPWLMRVNGNGVVWQTQFGTSGADTALTLSQDATGGVFVAGRTTEDLAGTNVGSNDVWFARFDGAGTQLWAQQLGTPDMEYVNDSEPDGAGGLYLCGSTQGDFGSGGIAAGRGWIAHFESSGALIWNQQYGGPRSQVARRMDSNGVGSLLLAGSVNAPSGPSSTWVNAYVARFDDVTSTSYCGPAVPNSTGMGAKIQATGTSDVTQNAVSLLATDLPPGAFGYFIVSRMQGFAAGPGGSQGNLCLGTNVGRYVGPGQIQTAGPSGSFELALDLGAIPHPLGPRQGIAGEIWNFQAWYRDANPTSTSNFTDGIAVGLR